MDKQRVAEELVRVARQLSASPDEWGGIQRDAKRLIDDLQKERKYYNRIFDPKEPTDKKMMRALDEALAAAKQTYNWITDAMMEREILNRYGSETTRITASRGIRSMLDAAEKMAKGGGRGLELARREIDQVAREAAALNKEIWKIMNESGRGSDAAGSIAEREVVEALKKAL